MQKEMEFGAADNAAKRGARLSERQALLVAVAAKSTGEPDFDYKGFIGFNVTMRAGARVAWIGNGGALRIGKPGEHPRAALSYSPGGTAGQYRPGIHAGLVKLGRELVARHNLRPWSIRALSLANVYGTPLDEIRAAHKRDRAAS